MILKIIISFCLIRNYLWIYWRGINHLVVWKVKVVAHNNCNYYTGKQLFSTVLPNINLRTVK